MTAAQIHLLTIAHLGATWYMVGLIWFVQCVHYPLFAEVGPEHYSRYQRRHVDLTGWVVGPAMLVEACTGVLLVVQASGDDLIWAWRALSLLILIWMVTALISVPAHRRLANGFDPVIHQRLVRSNWVRTAAWSVRAVLAVVLLVSLFPESSLS